MFSHPNNAAGFLADTNSVSNVCADYSTLQDYMLPIQLTCAGRGPCHWPVSQLSVHLKHLASASTNMAVSATPYCYCRQPERYKCLREFYHRRGDKRGCNGVVNRCN